MLTRFDAAISRSELTALIEQTARELSLPVDLELVGGGLLANIGILVEHAPDKLRFIHRSFLEFFAARGVAAIEGANAIVERVDDPLWLGATLFYVSDHDASAVINACLNSGTSEALYLLKEVLETGAEMEKDLLRQALTALAHT